MAIALFASATWALAQLPGGYSNAPTSTDYRMTVMEPSEGATIRGTDVSIVLRLPRVPEGQGTSEKERRDVMTPMFQFFVDGKSVGNLPIGENVFTAHDLSYGPHKIAVVAKNTAGEVLDRKEIDITTVAQVVESKPAITTESAPAPAAPRAEPVPAPEPSAPSVPPSAAPSTLPQTGSSYPVAALAGLGMILAGATLRRQS